MNMDLVVVFGFVATVVLIVTMGIVLFPISRKLGHFLEEAARERAERIASRATGAQQALPSQVEQQLVNLMGSLEQQVSQLAERQEFTEKLLEERQRAGAPPSSASDTD